MRSHSALAGIAFIALAACDDRGILEPAAGPPSSGLPSMQAEGGTALAGWVPLAPTSSPNWEIGDVADFTGDGKPDVLWQNRVSREAGAWIMDGLTLSGWVYIAPVESADWRIGGAADITRDGRTDIMWHDRRSLRTGTWVMNRTTYSGWIPTVDFESGDWQVGGVAEMSGDGRPDVVWQNRVTRQVGIWIMDGTRYVGWVPVAPAVSGDWEIGGVADLTRDGKADIVWQNRVTQQTGVWVMDGTRLTAWVEMRRAMSPNWEMRGVADLTGDGHHDIIWLDRTSSSTNGYTGVWIMNGTTVTSWESVASIVVTPETATLSVGSSRQLGVAVRDANGDALTGRMVTWTSSSPGVASVDGSGLVTAAASGTTVVVATSEEKSDTARIDVPATTIIDTRIGAAGATTFTFGGTYIDGTLSSVNYYGQTFTVGSRPRLDSFTLIFKDPSSGPHGTDEMRYRAVIARYGGGQASGVAWQSEVRQGAVVEEQHAPGVILEPGATYIVYLSMEPASPNTASTSNAYRTYRAVGDGSYTQGTMMQWSGAMPADPANSSGWTPVTSPYPNMDLSVVAAFSSP